ncbi:LysE family translocator [Streptomyces sp. 900116325]
MNLDLLAPFLLAVVVIQLTPGPGMLFILTQAMTSGCRAGRAAACGAASAMLIHTMAVALGLAALLHAAPMAMNLLRIGGAAYLLWLAIQAFRSPDLVLDAHAETTQGGFGVVFLRGAINDLANPKIVIFYLAFLPQFVDPSLGHLPLQLFVLGLMLLTVGFVVDLAIVMVAGRIGLLLRRRPMVNRCLSKLAGTVYGFLAVRLAVSD